ncbi:DUF2958 domain-containing protein [Dethiothermospora halolimnae]|uniref:DUF2958 domain-containing protein n=1 Tax=Dethiothermospora halolimnae TaxID=3114390 RepID=UPI003CCC084C
MAKELFNKELKERLGVSALYEQEDKEDPTVYVKFFDIFSNWTWYVMESREQEDGDYLFFGFVAGMENELGYFSLRELESVNKKFPRIERDLHFKPTLLSNIRKKYKEPYRPYPKL